MTSDRTTPLPDAGALRGLLTVHRGQLFAVAAIGVVLGVIAILFPAATLLSVAILFGVYLIASGVFRVTAAFIASTAPTGFRWLTGIMGVLILVVGVLCLANPFESLELLALVIGLGWIFEGVVDLVAGARRTISPRWLGFVSGVLSISAGVAMFVLPAAGLGALVAIGGILLIVVSVSTLITLPRRRSDEA